MSTVTHTAGGHEAFILLFISISIKVTSSMKLLGFMAHLELVEYSAESGGVGWEYPRQEHHTILVFLHETQ